MKIGFVGDLHARLTPPPSRADVMEDVIVRKLVWIRDTCLREGVEVLILCGDLTDPRPPSLALVYNLARWLTLLRPLRVYTLVGNHDIVTSEWSTVDVLEKMGVLNRLDTLEVDGRVIVGEHWGEDKRGVECDVLVCHRSVIPPSEAAATYVEGSIEPEMFLRDVKARHVVCGHFHYPYFVEVEGRYCLDPGVVIRCRRDELNKVSSLWVWDTATDVWTSYRLPQVVVDVPVVPQKVDTFDELVTSLLNLLPAVGDDWLTREIDGAPKHIREVLQEVLSQVKG